MLETMKPDRSMFHEFMGQALNIQGRTSATYSDELRIRKAKIYKFLGH